MHLPSNYIDRRSVLRQQIKEVFDNFSPYVRLRGSWEHNDFHLLPDGITTFSDLDVIALQSQADECAYLSDQIKTKTDQFISMRVSVHPNDDLNKVSFADAKVKNILEYIISYRRDIHLGHAQNEYMKAKTLMLLLNKEEGNRYAEIRQQFDSPAIDSLYHIKIGTLDKMNIEYAAKLIKEHGDLMARTFFNHCIIQRPSNQFVESILAQFRECHSVGPWLKSYILKKFNYTHA